MALMAFRPQGIFASVRSCCSMCEDLHTIAAEPGVAKPDPVLEIRGCAGRSVACRPST